MYVEYSDCMLLNDYRKTSTVALLYLTIELAKIRVTIGFSIVPEVSRIMELNFHEAIFIKNVS